MLNFEHVWKCTPEMHPDPRLQISKNWSKIDTPLVFGAPVGGEAVRFTLYHSAAFKHNGIPEDRPSRNHSSEFSRGVWRNVKGGAGVHFQNVKIILPYFSHSILVYFISNAWGRGGRRMAPKYAPGIFSVRFCWLSVSDSSSWAFATLRILYMTSNNTRTRRARAWYKKWTNKTAHYQ